MGYLLMLVLWGNRDRAAGDTALQKELQPADGNELIYRGLLSLSKIFSTQT